MSDQLSPRNISAPITRQYSNFAGVDFLNDPTKVAVNRSPDSKNMYKNYVSGGECIETRPGTIKLNNLEQRINGIYFYEINKKYVVIIHSGVNLYKCNNITDSIEDCELLYDNMNNRKTSFFVFASKLYILDGINYLVYDGITLSNVSNNSYIPTTTISRSPSGGGELYEDVNLLNPKRINQFCADGESIDYYLDAEDIDEAIVEVKANGDTLIENNDFVVDRKKGKVTFNQIISAPDLDGNDNVYITFSKTVENYLERISKCTISQVFDNRVFFSGNKDYPNAVFHSRLENPTYVSDLDYYQDGLDNNKIKSMCVGNNLLWVFKESNQQNSTIFYHTPTIDSENGKIYPSAQGNVSLGCYSECINFNDDIVFISRYGLEAISGNITSEQVLSHRSSLVDLKMTNEIGFENCLLAEWRGYLLCVIGTKIYLADSRQIYNGIKGKEYEWYYWTNISDDNSNISAIREYKDELYIGFENGTLMKLGGTNDNQKAIEAYWTTPKDTFGHENKYKSINKRGAVVNVKTIPNGKIKIAKKTDKENWNLLSQFSLSGFDFSNIDFSNFDFSTSEHNYAILPAKTKKIIYMSLKFYSDEIDKPFGIYSANLEAFIGGYVKR